MYQLQDIYSLIRKTLSICCNFTFILGCSLTILKCGTIDNLERGNIYCLFPTPESIFSQYFVSLYVKSIVSYGIILLPLVWCIWLWSGGLALCNIHVSTCQPGSQLPTCTSPHAHAHMPSRMSVPGEVFGTYTLLEPIKLVQVSPLCWGSIPRAAYKSISHKSVYIGGCRKCCWVVCSSPKLIQGNYRTKEAVWPASIVIGLLRMQNPTE